MDNNDVSHPAMGTANTAMNKQANPSMHWPHTRPEQVEISSSVSRISSSPLRCRPSKLREGEKQFKMGVPACVSLMKEMVLACPNCFIRGA